MGDTPSAQNPRSRTIDFDAIFNFRDLGGYAAKDGWKVAWQHIFRSGMLCNATPKDVKRLKESMGLKSVLDLRNKAQIDLQGTGAAKDEFKWRNVPLGSDSIPIDIESLHKLSNCGEVYLLAIGQEEYGRRLVECLTIIAEPDYRPLVFHCSAGKDRTGVLAAILLSLLNVADGDIAKDYSLTAPHMKAHLERLRRDPKDAKFLDSLPTWLHESSAESMRLFLSMMRREYGSTTDYLVSHGADRSLFERLERALLV